MFSGRAAARIPDDAAGRPHATRPLTAFDTVTRYGRDPDPRPDVDSTFGVSVATLEDMKALYDGFGLTLPTTPVSMTINGPAPTVLACFLNTVIDQQLEKFCADTRVSDA